MNVRSDDLLLRQLGDALAGLDLGPVPPAPVAAVLRDGRRRRATRTGVSLGAVAVAASVALAALVWPGPSGRSAIPAPPPPATTTAPTTTASTTAATTRPAATEGWDSLLTPGAVSGLVTVRPGRKVRQQWGTVTLRQVAPDEGQECIQYRDDPEPSCRRIHTDYGPLSNVGPNSVGLQSALGPAFVALGGTYYGPRPDRVTLRIRGITVHGALLVLADYPGWATWVVDGPAADAAGRLMPASPTSRNSPAYSIVVSDARGRTLAEYRRPERRDGTIVPGTAGP